MGGLQEDIMNDEEGMTKYGVDEGHPEQEELEKMAAEGCPLCGKKPIRQGAILLCPSHGTEPFERRD